MSRPILSRVLLTIGVLATLAAGWAIFNAASALAGAAPSPRPSTAAVARPREWIRLDAAVLRCETRTVRRGATFFLASEGDAPPFVVQLLGDVPCTGARLEGAFAPAPLPRESLLQNAGLALPADLREVRFFSEGYGPPYQRTVLVRMLPLLGIGLVLIWIGIRGSRRAERRG